MDQYSTKHASSLSTDGRGRKEGASRVLSVQQSSSSSVFRTRVQRTCMWRGNTLPLFTQVVENCNSNHGRTANRASEKHLNPSRVQVYLVTDQTRVWVSSKKKSRSKAFYPPEHDSTSPEDRSWPQTTGWCLLSQGSQTSAHFSAAARVVLRTTVQLCVQVVWHGRSRVVLWAVLELRFVNCMWALGPVRSPTIVARRSHSTCMVWVRWRVCPS